VEAGSPDSLGSGPTRFDHQQLALYGEASIDLTPAWTVTFGGRWFRFEESSRVAVKGILGNPEPTLNSADETGFVPKVMVSWAVDPDTLLYAAATQGFRPGGPNFAAVPLPLCEDELHSVGLDAAPKSYESDSFWNYELGVRSTKLNRRLRMSAAAFHVDWSDVQILAFLSCGAGFMSNAAQARSDGVEAEAEFSATDSLTLGLSGAYIDARVTRDVTVLSVEAGEQMPGVPKFIFVPEGAPRLTAPSYQVVDLHLGVERGRWSASIFVDNVLDEYGIVNRVDDTGLHPSGDFQNLIQPRTIGLTVRTRFQ
jgi:outer membrane receptor protein involved in Fe transport